MNIDTLLIVGNGFDLQAKLKSDFISFMKWVAKQNDDFTNKNIWYFLLNKTFFDNSQAYIGDAKRRFITVSQVFKHFIDVSNSENWMDVEYFVFKFLTNKECFLRFEEVYENICDRGFDKKDYFCLPQDNVNLILFDNIKTRRDEPFIYDYLFESLNEFESKFKEYLQSLVENEVYKNNISKIIGSMDLDIDNLRILNFNYTNILPNSFMSRECHVHGSLLDDVIIGVDLEEVEKSNIDIGLKKNIYRFTKTYRKLLRTDKTSILSKKYNRIIIYGHSLSNQDFSYFKSVFDCCKIEELKTPIEFWYSDNIQGRDKNEIRDNYVKKIAELFLKYGESLSNKMNGDNLMNKLMLNNKLLVPKAFNFID